MDGISARKISRTSPHLCAAWEMFRRTGKRLWTFRTIPQPGEFGHETWEKGSWEFTGNTGAWGPLSADEELGYVYVPVETPTGDFYGGHRPGDNLFADSLVCLDARTGRRVWHFQLVHHGVWDWDPPTAPRCSTSPSTDDALRPSRRSPSRPSPMCSTA